MPPISRFKIPFIALVCSIVFIVVGLVSLIGLLDRDFRQFAVPGEYTYTVAKAPENVIVWNEYETMFDGRFIDHDDDLPSGASVKVTGPGGVSPKLESEINRTMNSGGTYRKGVVSFDAPVAGEYRIHVSGTESGSVFSVGNGAFLKHVFFALLAGFGAVISGVVFVISLVIAFVVQRKNA